MQTLEIVGGVQTLLRGRCPADKIKKKFF